MQSPFLFVLCQVGAEKALKDELKAAYPKLTPSFSRPGFLTFKSQEGELSEDFELASVFARAYGVCLGKADLEAVAEFAKSGEFRLHVFERDRFAPSEEPKGFVAGGWASRVRLSGKFLEGSLAQAGDRVLSVICVEENEIWHGVHVHSRFHSPVPGGRWDIVLPEGAPSRAYLKLEEAIAWGNIPVRSGDTAVEIGSAPGGATYALLRRGVSVVGIDPGEMHPHVTGFPGPARFKHIASPIADVLREDLPAKVDWLLVDMNVEPRIALAAADRMSARMKDGLLGVILTLKLNQWEFAKQIPSWVDHVKAMGMSRVRAAQLSHNRQEICVYGLTRQGMKRLV